MAEKVDTTQMRKRADWCEEDGRISSAFLLRAAADELDALRALIGEATTTFLDPMFDTPNAKDVIEWCEKARKLVP